MLCEKDGSGDTQRWFVYGNYIDEVLVMSDTSGASAVDYYYTADHLYSAAALLDDTGDVLERYEYDAYGELRYLDADFTLKASQSSAYDNPYYFTGRRLDVLDGGDLTLQHNRHRTYDPETGRWLTHDPIGYDDGMNLYQYVHNNPVLTTDPLGLFELGKSECTLKASGNLLLPKGTPPQGWGCSCANKKTKGNFQHVARIWWQPKEEKAGSTATRDQRTGIIIQILKVLVEHGLRGSLPGFQTTGKLPHPTLIVVWPARIDYSHSKCCRREMYKQSSKTGRLVAVCVRKSVGMEGEIKNDPSGIAQYAQSIETLRWEAEREAKKWSINQMKKSSMPRCCIKNNSKKYKFPKE